MATVYIGAIVHTNDIGKYEKMNSQFNSQFNSLSLFVVKGKTVFDCWQILGTVFLNCQSLAVSRQMSVGGHYLDRGTHSIDSFYHFLQKIHLANQGDWFESSQ